MIDPNIALEAGTGAITAIGGIWAAARHLILKHRRKRELYRAEILEQAKYEVNKIRYVLEDKIKDLENEFNIQKDNVSKDFEHFKQTYNNEIKVLGEKIEALREDLSQQHQALVGLLTRLIDSK